jgi:hypothetical protein
MADYERAQTVEAPAGALFEFLSDVGNLPRYFERMTAAEPAGGEAVRVRAEIDGHVQEGEAWFRVDRDALRVEWGVGVHVSTERVEDRPDEINERVGRVCPARMRQGLPKDHRRSCDADTRPTRSGIDRTLGNVKRLVEEPGGADA